MTAPTRPRRGRAAPGNARSRPAQQRPRQPKPPAGPRARKPVARPVPRVHTAGDPRRRIITLLVVVALAFVAVIARLTYVQALEADRYAAFGETQRVRKIALPAARGAIFDRRGRELALTVRQPTVWANPKLVTDPLGAAAALAPILGKEPTQLQDQLTRDASFVYLARKIPEDVAAKVEGLRLDGVFLLSGGEPQRFLPSGPLATSVLGHVGADNEGLSGLEMRFEKQLAGRPGRLVVERDPSGLRIPGGVRQHIPSLRGDDVVLTLDRALQYETERALSAQIVQASAKGGMAIVMESTTGEILAMANLVAEDGGDPVPATGNRAVASVFEPGSVNKMITIAGALEDKLIRPNQSLVVPPAIKVGNKLFRELKPHPPEKWSITDIVANSSNVGSIMIGQKLGKQRLDDYLRAFGFGERTALAFPGESRGLLIDPKNWYSTSLGTVPIGQGVAVTGIQMLAAYNTIANGGVYVAPKLVQATIDKAGERRPTPPSAERRVVSTDTAREMTAMLAEVVRVGTGKQAAIEGYTVAGKTGTARKPDEKVRGYKAGAYVASFAGFLPAERPAMSAIVILDEPTPIYGGVVAAPVFAEITKYALRDLRIPPPGEVAPTAAPAADPEAARPVGEVEAVVTEVGPPTTTLPSGGPSRSP